MTAAGDSNGQALAIVLAAGEGTRMRSRRPKVLHEIAGRSMLGHVLAAVAEAGIGRVAVVIGPGHEAVAAEARRLAPHADIFVQTERLGTAHAALAARAALADAPDQALVLFADTPFVSSATLLRMREAVAAGAKVVAVGFEAEDPTGYGRLILRDGDLVAIREHRDATEAERAITLCNCGLMAFDGAAMSGILDEVRDANAQRQFYLTDAVEIARTQGLRVAALSAPESEVLGVNDRIQLAGAEAVMQAALRARLMRGGATLIAPETVFLSHDTVVGMDVTIEPHVVIGPGVAIADGAVIHAFCHLEGAHVGRNASVGPFARLRPGADLGEKSRVGNFVEVKNATFGAGAKANHLAYVGDASVGANANIGAGAITCNYDGADKHRTEIGDGAFVGTNCSLVAPVRIGAGAYVGSGSVITKNVPDDALAVARGRQEMREGWASAKRARDLAAKQARTGKSGAKADVG
jgi:bifunctional UDP-N-acetylglucosamine pyrophosphorylase/glucosamine-1-phosphate N-acetyltransferase